MALNADLRQ